MAKIRML